MIAKLAYLTSPTPNVYRLNFQLEDGTTFVQFDISKAHLANILIDGTAMALRENSIHRVIETPAENANVRADHRA